MLKERRYDEILNMLAQRGSLPIRTVAEELRISEATARRDVTHLAAEGRLSRVHGGAVVQGPAEIAFAHSASTDIEEKRNIAAAAARLVSDGDTVVLDIGSTVLELSRILAGRPITIVTSNLAVYEVIKNSPATELILLGGQLRRNYQSTVGFLTESAIRQLHADVAFLGTSGITLDGKILDTTPVEVSIKKAIIASASVVSLLATARKFPGSGPSVVCDITQIDRLITSPSAPDAYVDELERQGAEVVRARSTHR